MCVCITRTCSHTFTDMHTYRNIYIIFVIFYICIYTCTYSTPCAMKPDTPMPNWLRLGCLKGVRIH